MTKYAIIIDSTSDIPQKLVDEYRLYTIPVYIIFPDTDEALKDKIEISREQYFERLEQAKKHPFTTQPSPNEFLTLYNKLEKEGIKEILYIPFSSKLSGLYNNAHLAKKIYLKEGGKSEVEIHDSKQSSMGVGIQALKAVNLFQQGLNLKEVVEKLEHFRENQLKSTLVVATLKYLMKGGRISKIQYAIGSVLSLTPCLEGTSEGLLVAFDRTKNYKDGIKRVIDRAFEEIKEKEDLAVYIIEGKAEKGVKIAKTYFQEKYPDIELLGELPLGAAIYTHTGPGVVAFILFKNFDF